ncbi:hypothetical protein [Bosea sp. RAC05]|uniref:hypothetical protein n=1 Tax=Bosea sp. RAC05 TaxID=1842539 RepID=UPI00083E53A8|nr:hypothetical protein [Bosea sp. RAC05]AOG02962.1 hypothetical protein BSY19_5235 [Bosea sp. RAC05]
MKISILAASIVALMTLSSAHAFQSESESPQASPFNPILEKADAAIVPIPRTSAEQIDFIAGGEIVGDAPSQSMIHSAQYQDHTWNPTWGAPYNPGISVQDSRARGSWEYQVYYIQTSGTNGFIIVYYNLICAGAGVRCPSTTASATCWIAGGIIGDCLDGVNATIPRNF